MFAAIKAYYVLMYRAWRIARIMRREGYDAGVGFGLRRGWIESYDEGKVVLRTPLRKEVKV